MIPVSIIIVQKWAKKLLSKYWGQYTALGDTFLENLQGLTTLKVYQSDQYKNEKMLLTEFVNIAFARYTYIQSRDFL